MTTQKDWLGQDTICPIIGAFKPSTGMNEVNQCIQLLIATIPGERVMRPEYGCRLYTKIWDNLDLVASEGLTDIREAIDNFEPRVNLVSINSRIFRDEGRVLFAIEYRLKDSNVVENLVFPFSPVRN
jgi:phage baseplate assembly protein W